MDTTGTLWMPPSGSTMAEEIDPIFYFLFYASLVFFALVVALVVLFVVKYRRRGELTTTSGVDHNLKLEILWTVIPTILLVIAFIWGFKSYLRLWVVPKDAIEIKVTGQKWFWSFEYPEGANAVNELTVPVGKPVKLLMSSKDVIHSFYVPNFRVKMDVLPNRYSVTWFEATQTGQFNLFCTEFCGDGHSTMVGKVNVVSELEYNKWLESAELGEGMSLADFGGKLFQSKACITCHTTDGSRNTGPTLKNVFGHEVQLSTGETITVDENYIRRSILEPMGDVVMGYAPIMPTYQGLLKDRQIDALIAYIKTLSDKAPAEEPAEDTTTTTNSENPESQNNE